MELGSFPFVSTYLTKVEDSLIILLAFMYLEFPLFAVLVLLLTFDMLLDFMLVVLDALKFLFSLLLTLDNSFALLFVLDNLTLHHYYPRQYSITHYQLNYPSLLVFLILHYPHLQHMMYSSKYRPMLSLLEKPFSY